MYVELPHGDVVYPGKSRLLRAKSVSVSLSSGLAF